jgi:hypothetical protein
MSGTIEEAKELGSRTLKTVGVAVGVVTFFIGGVHPSVDCGPREICEVVADLGEHNHPREPGPVETVDGRPVITATTSASSAMTVLGAAL